MQFAFPIFHKTYLVLFSSQGLPQVGGLLMI